MNEFDGQNPEIPLTQKQLLMEQAEQLGVSEADIVNIIQQIRHKSQLQKNAILRARARELQIGESDLEAVVLGYERERIRESSLGANYHYHSTSASVLASILEAGSLLSRSERKRKNPDVSPSSWSARDEVMMTRDMYDQNGRLIRPGLDQITGAAGRDITFVLNESVMDLPGYDAIDTFPCLSEIPINNSVTAILVDTEAAVSVVRDILNTFGFANIPVQTKEQWKTEHYSKS